MLIIIFILVIVINAVVASYMKSVAKDKEQPTEWIFAICFFLGPIGWIYVASLPDCACRGVQKELLHNQETILKNQKEIMRLLNEDALPSLSSDVMAEERFNDELPPL